MDIRQHPEATATMIPLMPVKTVLPARRSQWPSDARDAFGGVLNELSAWCRENDWPMVLNHSMAEEAVRRTWGDASQCV
ncbi:MAG: hypothetical protein DRJ65_00985 [Acidobacteria bacterium]|nr:MAG: hypothetical protein DRJ65_00985 [Acidobacteriota bacterium]